MYKYRLYLTENTGVFIIIANPLIMLSEVTGVFPDNYMKHTHSAPNRGSLKTTVRIEKRTIEVVSPFHG